MTRHQQPVVNDDPVALLAPTGRDAAVGRKVLAGAGFTVSTYDTLEDVCTAIRDGSLGACVIAQEALPGAACDRLLDGLDAQPSWSNLPIAVLTGEGALSSAMPAELERLAKRANVTLLERPVRVATLVTTLGAALHARRRQRQLRDAIDSEREARRQSEDANRAKTNFLAMMSHELRTPLNAIGGYAQILAMGVHGDLTDAQRLDLERIDRNQRHLLSLINDILNFAKIEAGHVEIRLGPVSLRHVMCNVDPLVAPQLSAKALVYANHSEEDVVAHADEEKVVQIVLNLLSNAVKFTPRGGRIDVRAAADANVVRLTVTDTGIGIPDDKLTAIFEPFVQVERSFTTVAEGTGLGLSISRDLARAMGGDIVVRSEPGNGAEFTLVLPREQESERGT